MTVTHLVEVQSKQIKAINYCTFSKNWHHTTTKLQQIHLSHKQLTLISTLLFLQSVVFTLVINTLALPQVDNNDTCLWCGFTTKTAVYLCKVIKKNRMSWLWICLHQHSPTNLTYIWTVLMNSYLLKHSINSTEMD